jgi:hypothetical protein
MNAGGGASPPNDVRAKIEAIAEAEKRQREKAEAAKKASEKAAEIVKARTTITGELKRQNWTIPANKNKIAQMNKLIDKQTIAVTTQRGNLINVKFEGGKLKQA